MMMMRVRIQKQKIMKKHLKRWACLLPVLGGLAACANQQETEVETPFSVKEEGKMIHFTTRSIDTKAVFGDAVDSDGTVTYPTYWSENDQALMISLNYEYAVTAGISSDEKDSDGNITRAVFDASFSGIDTESPYRFYLVSPASALLWASPGREAVSVYVMANQTPLASSVDESAMVIVAASGEYTALPDNVEVDFTHITSYGKLTLKNLSIPDGATLTSVTLVCEEQPLSGSWYYKFGDGSIEEKEGSASIVLDTENVDVAAGDPVWFACAPVGTALAGKALTIKANLDNGTSLVRTITLHSTVDYQPGRITAFSVSMAKAETVSSEVDTSVSEEVYEQVTSVSSLSSGDEVIIVNSTSPTYAMTGTSSSSGMSPVAKDATSGFTLGSDGYIRLPSGTAVQKLYVKSISGSSIVLWDGSSNYLSYTSSGNGQNSSRYLSWSTSSRTWTISFSNGAAKLYTSSGSSGSYSGGSNRSYYLRYSSNYFNVNTSSGTCAIYRKTTATTTGSVDLSDDPVTGYSDFGAYLDGTNLIYNATTDQLSREYATDGTTLTFSIVAPAEDQVVEFSGIPSSGVTLGDSFTLQLTYISGVTTEIDATYTVYVVKEEGHRLWLTDGAGNGFIVKR